MKDDVIYRRDAVDALDVGAELLRRVLDNTDVVGVEREKYEWGLGLIESYISDMKELSSAQQDVADINVGDMVSRQAAIDALHMHLMYRMGTDSNKKRLDEWINNLPSAQPEIIRCKDCKLFRNSEQLPSAQPEQRWIPCSERLPEVYKDVLICWDFKGNREVLIGNMYSDGTFHGYDDEYLTHNGRKYRKAVAWMPLPEPYREERTEE